MLIPEHKIQEVLERVDLVALVGRYVELKKAGRSYKGRCPFHQEKTPSFQVTPEMRRYKCFGCQAGGDAISFVQRYLGKSFVDAVKDLAKEVGVELTSAEDPGARERQQLKDATDFAARHFQARLWHPEAGKAGRAYLESRGVTPDVAKAFGLGWSVNAWSDLADAMAKEGMVEWGVSAGLLKKRERGDGHYDFFRGRLMIPIRSPEGRTIAFGGRLVEGDPNSGPKYFNSRESRLYNKSETLYALDLAREEVRKKRSAILVEGYFDVIGMHQAGVKNVVALCSTALTQGHLGVLARAEAKELVLLLDGDNAGRKAVEALAGPILAHGVAAKVALLPEGEDPDTFAKKAGVEGVQQLLGGARPLTQHLFSAVLPAGREASFEEKMQALDRLKPVTGALPVGLVRSAFFEALSRWSGLPAAELETALRGKEHSVRPVPKPEGNVSTRPGVSPGVNTSRDPGAGPGPDRMGRPVPFRNGNGQAMAAQGPAAAGTPVRKLAERPPDPLEAVFVAMVLRDQRLLRLDQYRVHDELGHPGLRSALAHVQSGHGAEDALFEASEPVRRALADAARQLPEDDQSLAGMFGAVCTKLKLRSIDQQLTQIARVTGQTAMASDLTEDTRRLLAERADLLALRKRVISEGSGVTAGTKVPPGSV